MLQGTIYPDTAIGVVLRNNDHFNRRLSRLAQAFVERQECLNQRECHALRDDLFFMFTLVVDERLGATFLVDAILLIEL